MEKLILRLNASQSEQLQMHQQETDSLKASAEGTIKSLKQNVETLLTEIEHHKTSAALAKAETDRLKQVFLIDTTEKLASQAAELRKEHEKELADRDYAFSNAQETIESLQNEV